jgi:hypothetical protein
MSTRSAGTLKTSSFTYAGFDVPALEVPVSLIDDLGTDRPAYELASQSTPLAWKVALYTVGRDLALGVDAARVLPQAARELGRRVYASAHKREAQGTWHKDGVILLPRNARPKGVMLPDGFVPAKYFKDILGFEEKGNEWEIQPSQKTEEILTYMPRGAGRYVVPTMDGTYNPTTGTPFDTVLNKDVAIRRWLAAGLSEEQAEKELSLFLREEIGTYAVRSWSGSEGGPLGISLGETPDKGDEDTGSFPARRKGERTHSVM